MLKQTQQQPQQRPQRIQMPNFSGRSLTLHDAPGAYQLLHDTQAHKTQITVLLGCGPLLQSPCVPPNLFEGENTVYVLYGPKFLEHMQQSKAGAMLWKERIPKHWQSITYQDFHTLLANNTSIAFWWYKQNLDLESDFWLPILGESKAHILCAKTPYSVETQAPQKQETTTQDKNNTCIFLGSSPDKLLYKEVHSAFLQLGYTPYTCPHSLQDMQETLQKQCALFFSVNLQGLDVEGHDFALLRALRIAVGIWFVDNPWHVLASLRVPWWKKAKLFVTDASFILPLKEAGAEHVYHLPLAVAQHMWGANEKSNLQPLEITANTKPQQRNSNSNNRNALSLSEKLKAASNASCVFVGHAAFPHKKSFFAAAKIQPERLQQAMTLLKNGPEVPDFQWWVQHAATQAQDKLWPGHSVRSIGLGAEQCAQEQRVLWIQQLLAQNPAIFGDAALWQSLLPEAKQEIFHAPLDYYTELPFIYAAANAVLNVTSLLLPWGLTQRHFDVWAAGGFLWTNSTKGLEIFPQELTRPISFERPQQWTKAMAEHTPRIKEDLQDAWKKHLKEEHQYVHRMVFVLEKTLG